ncbi:MFS transporter [Acinetobacter seifertii]|uniref:MFS transporter n=1 Tax=Acinetobacter seifertii TaxID=1530123 RepID=UPI001F054991|nr:MFS transporter [Acinetobacter seifertii]MCH2001106.1 MFS transporter [Acinetobacter seifertii]
MKNDIAISEVEKSTIRKLSFRILPFLILCYFIAYIDRVNIGFAALTMNQEIGLTATAFGFGATLFFIAYVIFEIPSNMAMEKLGARIWIARIMITWGIVGFCTAFITGPISYAISRFLLGAAEAGFFPGVLLYLTLWFPKRYMARIVAVFMVAIPLSNFIGSPLSALLLGLHGLVGLSGWQVLLIFEALPAILLGILCLVWLPNNPNQVKWLSSEQREWLSNTLTFEKNQLLNTEKQDTAEQKKSKFKLLITNKYLWFFAIIYAGSSATSNILSLWMPQILKAFHLTAMQTGLLNMIPFGLAAAFMIVWGVHADKSGNKSLNTAIPLFVTSFGLLLTLFTSSLTLSLLLFSLVLMGNYAIKGPFWALVSERLPPTLVAVGIAAVNTIAHIGTGLMNSIMGIVKDYSGSFPVSLLPLCILTFIGAMIALYLGRKPTLPKAQKVQKVV